MKATVSTKRSANWDLLRAFAMFFVIVVHSLRLISGEKAIPGINTSILVGIAIMCDPVFFTLSGYFAIRPMKRSLKNYYLNKLSTIILPLVLYAILLYLYSIRHNILSASPNSFFSFFTTKLSGAWWFIPALVPCLAAAPFISKAFDHLSDRQVFAIGAVTATIYLWGLGMSFLDWTGETLDIPTISSFSRLSLQLVPPGLLVATTAYFQFFIMGGVFRRLAHRLRGRTGTMLIVVGLLFWVQDILFSINDIPGANPSYSWMFVSFGIMVLFDRITIVAKSPSALITWLGKRSYSIYLLHFLMLDIVGKLLYERNVLGVVNNMSDPDRFFIWILATISTYLSALAIASICDPLLLSPLQRLFSRHFMKQPKIADTRKNH